ncbi:uncharacterized protein CC84DRAFT_279875 [Paraphaeosphaeria sporulosa]|uniref:Uncharacterized protein n=1 Tax=Paraphaeosphaeria sporulosa TaxID=1460663 RepID=A0A177C2V6_9PLEO|nr:uncharacterized protein CC84DRAFT_279875 [Paraphaeosphaeria sporulosa]OAG01192.1 hypothetical protein CC84DRAFT_279875 [Paraphaeosphaeria sporulosa]
MAHQPAWESSPQTRKAQSPPCLPQHTLRAVRGLSLHSLALTLMLKPLTLPPYPLFYVHFSLSRITLVVFRTTGLALVEAANSLPTLAKSGEAGVVPGLSTPWQQASLSTRIGAYIRPPPHRALTQDGYTASTSTTIVQRHERPPPTRSPTTSEQMPPRTPHGEREEPGRLLLSMAHLGATGGVSDDVADQVERTLGGNMDELSGNIQLAIAHPPHAAAAAPNAADIADSYIRDSLNRLRRDLQALDGHFDDHGRAFRRLELPTIARYVNRGDCLSRPALTVKYNRDGRPNRINNWSTCTGTVMSQDDNTYDLIVQGPTARSVHYGRGFRIRWPAARVRYRIDRDIPLSPEDTCRCVLFRTEYNRRFVQTLDWHDWMQNRIRCERRRTRRQALGETGLFSTIPDHALVELRQGRALAGVDVSEYDVEITRRILEDPSGWGAVGSALRNRLWVDEVLEDGGNYVLL